MERKETDPIKRDSAPIRFVPLEVRLRAVHRDHQAGLEAIIRAGEKLPDSRLLDLAHGPGGRGAGSTPGRRYALARFAVWVSRGAGLYGA